MKKLPLSRPQKIAMGNLRIIFHVRQPQNITRLVASNEGSFRLQFP